MRTTGLGALVGAGLMLLAMLAIGLRNEAAAQYGGAGPSQGDLITLNATVENRLQSNADAIRWLLDKTLATTADRSDLNLTRAEAQQLAD